MMFSGFFGGIFALFCTGAIAVGGIVGIKRQLTTAKTKKATQLAAADRSRNIQLLAKEKGISLHEAEMELIYTDHKQQLQQSQEILDSKQ